jgi:hypothetical protein
MANSRKRDKDERRSAQEPKSRLSVLAAAERPRKPIDAKALSDLTDGMHKQSEPAGDFVRRMRDDSRC